MINLQNLIDDAKCYRPHSKKLMMVIRIRVGKYSRGSGIDMRELESSRSFKSGIVGHKDGRDARQIAVL
jgi:hypothetical protein